MIRIQWEPNGPPSADDRLAELSKMRQKYLREWHLDEDYYAARLKYVEQAEAAIHARRELPPRLEAMRQRAMNAVRDLSQTNPLDYMVICQKLRDYGYEGWQVDKLIQYASFIQARGWEAFYPEDAAFLKQKYAEVGVDAEKIDFRS